MPPAKRTTKRSSARKTTRRAAPKRRTGNEPAALRRLNKSLETAQDALTSLSKEVGKDVGAGTRSLHKNLTRFVKDARRDSGKFSKALQRDIEALQKRIANAPTGRKSNRGGARKSTARKSTARKSTARKTTAKRRSSSGSRSR